MLQYILLSGHTGIEDIALMGFMGIGILIILSYLASKATRQESDTNQNVWTLFNNLIKSLEARNEHIIAEEFKTSKRLVVGFVDGWSDFLENFKVAVSTNISNLTNLETKIANEIIKSAADRIMKFHQDFNERLIRLSSRWKEELRVNSGVSNKDIQRLTDQVNFHFEEDFEKYLLKMNGFEDFESDREFFSFWSIDRIQSELSNHPSNLICFADYCISLCSYGFNITDGKIYSHFQHQQTLHFICNSFSEFVELYLTDSDELVK